MDDFMLRALLAGIGVALVAGPLGSFVVWRRMAYFGDTLAHSALLGVALGFLLQTSVTLAVVAVCLLLALLLVALQRQRRLASDTLLGIMSHGSLALGLVVLAFMEGLRMDLLGYLFGDILSVAGMDIVWIYLTGLLVSAGLALIWRPLLADTVHEELARVEGVPVVPARLGFMLLLALFIAISMKVVGILLITALLIVPAATARRFAHTPERMALLASLIGCLSVAGGLSASLQWDLPAGPAAVLAAVVLFVVSLGWSGRE
ncbi:MAG TPA: zinc ABC transporter permease subunit ZnuB [Gammaproteobacteria bacterium]|nr:zinc ABC transporter permease subunit ZnuB [Gammaproteobacteria bacterium]